MENVLVVAFLLSPAIALAASVKSYIVEFHDHAVQSAPPPRLERRAKLDPDGWNGVNPGVLSLVQEVEEKALRRGSPFNTRYPYSYALKGFVAEMNEEQAKTLQADPLVRRVQADRTIKISSEAASWGIRHARAMLSPTRSASASASGVASNVNVYVIDSGIASHKNLTIGASVNFTEDVENTDCNGHGTHVAGTIGATDDVTGAIGMAPGVRLNAVKVLDCEGSGYVSNVLKGIDWVTANARLPAVANMSVGADLNDQLEEAVVRSVGSGIFYALAAGNDSVNACNISPARIGRWLPGAMTVAATDAADVEAPFSNYGGCVEIWAPGVDILSTWTQGRLAIDSGTSMAAPHVAGAAVLYLSRYPSSTPAVVERAIRQQAVMTGTLGKNGVPISKLDVIGF